MRGPAIVAAIQAEVAPDLEAGLERTFELIEEAAGGGATLVAFPETWLPGYPVWLDVCRGAGLWEHAATKRAYRWMAEQSVTVPGPAVERLCEAAADVGVTVVVGIVERVEAGAGRGTLYNALLTVAPDGRVLNHHRKLVPTHTERLVWGVGDADGVVAVDTPVGRVGGLVCWEHWMPLARQALHESGEDVHVAVWPTVKEMNLIACRQYAFEGRCYVVATGSLMRAAALPAGLEPDPERVAGPGSWVLRGGSAIIGPAGELVAGPVYEEECILRAEIDVGKLREEAMTLDVTGHYARPDCFRLRRFWAGRLSSGPPAVPAVDREGSLPPPGGHGHVGSDRSGVRARGDGGGGRAGAPPGEEQ